MFASWGQKSWEGDIKQFEDYGTRNLPELMTLGNAIDFQKELGLENSIRRRNELKQYFRKKVEERDDIIWSSPEAQDVSLFAIEIKGKKAGEISKDLYENHGFVFRPFQSESRNTIRISMNINNTREEIDRFFEVV